MAEEQLQQKIKLVQVEILSCYRDKQNKQLILPSRMAWCVPAMKEAMYALREELRSRGADLVLSDLYRSSDMQSAAHRRYMAAREEWEIKGKIGAPPKYSPPSGGSFHEAGRAMDVDLRALLPLASGNWAKVLDEFWPVAKKYGFRPIIDQPNEGQNESWHFDLWGADLQAKYEEGRKIPGGSGYRTAASYAISQREQPY